ncbi:MAG: hypothetical protein H6747_05050 [Deltaproteobacteria bacterium]|nr:hypothetical protein [Deltaproteobacteria bacterium]
MLGVPGLVGLMATVSGTSPIVLQLGGAGRDYQAWLGWSLLVPNAPGSKWRYDWQFVQVGAGYGTVSINTTAEEVPNKWHFAVASTFRCLREVAWGFGLEFFGQVGVGWNPLEDIDYFPQINFGIGVYR